MKYIQGLIVSLLIGFFCLLPHLSSAATYYVSPSGSDANNGSTWALAKKTIQAGVNEARAGDTVLVTNGTYVLTGAISITNGIVVCSVNGAALTVVNGNYPTTINRCFYLNHSNVVLNGFTVTNANSDYDDGGGIYMERGTVLNSTISGNSAGYDGGGLYLNRGMVSNCLIAGNTAENGGGAKCITGLILDSVIRNNGAEKSFGADGDGGGLYVDGTGVVERCAVFENSADNAGGGICLVGGRVTNCSVCNNTAGNYGGGIYNESGLVDGCMILNNYGDDAGGLDNESGGIIQNCFIAGNYAANDGGGIRNYNVLRNSTVIMNEAPARGGGVCMRSGSVIQNCIVYSNRINNLENGFGSRGYTSTYSCVWPAEPGVGNITNNPQLVDFGSGPALNYVAGNARLKSGSACINTGTNQAWMTNRVDLDGNPRIINVAVDIGAYEYCSNAPVVAFTQPTNGATYQAFNGCLAIAGTAVAGAGITNVAWYNSRGGHSNCNGAANWSATNITLCASQNIITVRAWDTGGNIGAASLSVFYTPPPAPPAAPQNFAATKGAYTDRVRTSWTAVSNATAYDVYRNTANDSGTATKLYQVITDSPFDDMTVAAGTTYYYWVKAKNSAGSSAFSASDSGFLGVVGPLITANGLVGDVYLYSSDTVAIAVQMMNIDPYIGTPVDWWVVACAGSSWYYMDSAAGWLEEGSMLNWHPVYQGGLFNLPAHEVLNTTGLGAGSYTFYFAVDLPMNGVLNLEQIYADSVTVHIQ